MRPQQLIQQWLLTLLQFSLRRSMVSQNENQKAVVAQELGSFADVAQKCQWCCPFGKRKLRDQRRDGKSKGYTFQILTTSLIPPWIPRANTAIWRLGNVTETSSCWAQTQSRLSQTGCWISCNPSRFLGSRLGCPEVTNELNSTISTIIPYI